MSPSADELLDDAWHRSRAAWPGVDVDAASFAAFVRERVDAARLADTLGTLALPDLYLACACLAGSKPALALFDRVHLAQVPKMLARLDGSGTIGHDALTLVRTRLLVASGEEPPRLAAYAGRGSLLAFLRTMALRVAIDLLRQREARHEVTLEDGLLDHQAYGGGADPELELIKERYRGVFEQAVRDAVTALPARSRTLLRLHLCNGVTTRALATMYGADQSTVVRWLAAARDSVRGDTHARLREALQLSESELESLAGLLLSRLDLSLAGCLQDG